MKSMWQTNKKTAISQAMTHGCFFHRFLWEQLLKEAKPLRNCSKIIRPVRLKIFSVALVQIS